MMGELGDQVVNVTCIISQREAGILRGRANRVQTPLSTSAALGRWAERDFIKNCSAQYAALPSPRSTIAVAFAADGSVVASTHGDHTVKVSECSTGRNIQVLDGHTRTPWVVRFNPANINVLASGSLDHQVNIWQVNTGHRLQHHNFGRPIASITFHANGDLMAVASGHKVYMWQYGIVGKAPATILKTRKSLRAIHFHPYGAPLLLTAEVVERKVSTQPDAAAPAAGEAAQPGQPAPAHAAPAPAPATVIPTAPPVRTPASEQAEAAAAQQAEALRQLSMLVYAANHTTSSIQQQALLQSVLHVRNSLYVPVPPPSQPHIQPPLESASQAESAGPRPLNEDNSARNPSWWDWWYGPQRRQRIEQRQQAGQVGCVSAASTSRQTAPITAPGSTSPPPIIPLMPSAAEVASYEKMWGWEVSQSASDEAVRHVRDRRAVTLEHQLPQAGVVEQPCIVSINLWPFDARKPRAALTNSRLHLPRTVLCSEMGAHFSRCGRYLAVVVSADTPSEPCEAWMRRKLAKQQGQQSAGYAAITQSPDSPATSPRAMFSMLGSAPLSPAIQATPGEDLQFSIELESGMVGGAPSPFPARTNMNLHQLLSSQLSLNPPAAGTSAPESTAERQAQAAAAPKGPLYELRVYSLDGATFGKVLQARPIRAVHCLTSIQFSPTSEHLLVAYGRRHMSLCSLLVDGGFLTPVHTILEIYRVSDMERVRILPALDDEVNVAAWHPVPGGGVAYGTKEGKLRLLRLDRRPPQRPNIPLVAKDVPRQADDELYEAELRSRNRSDSSDGAGLSS